MEDAEDNLTRVYTKDQKAGYGTIRYERQEYPNKTFEEAVKDILNPRSSYQKLSEINECNGEPIDHIVKRGR
jgi:hypothetical protein